MILAYSILRDGARRLWRCSKGTISQCHQQATYLRSIGVLALSWATVRRFEFTAGNSSARSLTDPFDKQGVTAESHCKANARMAWPEAMATCCRPPLR